MKLVYFLIGSILLLISCNVKCLKITKSELKFQTESKFSTILTATVKVVSTKAENALLIKNTKKFNKENSKYNTSFWTKSMKEEFEKELDNFDLDDDELDDFPNPPKKKKRGLFGSLANKAAGAINSGVNAAKKAVDKVENAITKTVDKGVNAANKAVDNVGNAIDKTINKGADIAKKAVDKVENVIGNGVKTVSKAADKVGNSIGITGVGNAVNNVGNQIKDKVGTALDDTINKGVDAVGKVVDNVGNKIKEGVDKFGNKIKDGVNAIGDKIDDYLDKILNDSNNSNGGGNNNNNSNNNNNNNNNNGGNNNYNNGGNNNYNNGGNNNNNNDNNNGGNNNNNNNNNNGGNNNNNNNFFNDTNNLWKNLFNSINRREICSRTKATYSSSEATSYTNIGYTGIKKPGNGGGIGYIALPFPKPGYDERKYGKGEAAYYFDYLDHCFQKPISNIFSKIYMEAKKIRDDPEKDPYSLINQLKNYRNQGIANNIDPMIFMQKTQDRLLERELTSANSNFNPIIFNLGISYWQLNVILKEWNWINNNLIHYPDPAKHLLDKYDWDGNGRLDPREFIFLSIKENFDNLGTKNPLKNFYNQFIFAFLDPIFSYADCDGDGLINSENLWFTSENLICRDSIRYDIYKCDAKNSDSNSDYRTASINDFILKNKGASDAYLSRNEFYKGILLGFWDRQVTNTGIFDSNEINEKDMRWGGANFLNGTVDLECESIKDLQRLLG